MSIEWITALTIVGYFVILLLVSHFTSRETSNDSFFRAKRQSPWPLVAIGMVGASVSGVSFVSVPGQVGHTQMTYLQMCLGFFVGYIIIAFVLLPMFYKRNLTTIYSYLGERLGLCSHKTGTSFFLLSKLTGACARFFLVCLVLQQFVFGKLGCPFVLTVLIMLFLVWLYTNRAGIRTIVYTDVLQTLFLLGTLAAVTICIASQMNLDFKGICQTVSESPYGKMFVIDDWMSKQSFWKQFFSGVFVAIVMNGLDQDMMQKNLTCKSIKDAQKDMIAYSCFFVPVNFILMVLGVLLYTFAINQGLSLPESSDNLFPMLVSGGYFGPVVIIMFVLGITAAAFSSVDSALTALTTSVCIDLLGIERRKDICRDEKKGKRIRRNVHIVVVCAFVACLLIFKALNNTSVIDAIYIMASYTYGPLLGMFAFGLFTKYTVRDRYVPFVAVISPIICYALSVYVPQYTGYQFGYELLMLNGFLTFTGLWALRKKQSV